MASLPPAGSQGAIFFFLLFQLMNTGWCQYSHLSEICRDCNVRNHPLTPLEMARYSRKETEVTPCLSSMIRFKFENGVVCGKSGEEWVDKLKHCINNQDFLKCRRKVGPKPAPAPTMVTTTTAVAAPTPALVLTTTDGTELVVHTTSTPKSPHITEKDEREVHLEPTNDAANETNNDALAAGGKLQDELKNSTPAPQPDKMKHLTVAVLSLLAVVFVLVGLVTYLFCRKKAQRMKYDEVLQNLETESLQ